MAEDEAANALVSAGAEEVVEMAGSRIVVPVVFVGAAVEVASRGGGEVSRVGCEGRCSMEYGLVGVEGEVIERERGRVAVGESTT